MAKRSSAESATWRRVGCDITDNEEYSLVQQGDYRYRIWVLVEEEGKNRHYHVHKGCNLVGTFPTLAEAQAEAEALAKPKGRAVPAKVEEPVVAEEEKAALVNADVLAQKEAIVALSVLSAKEKSERVAELLKAAGRYGVRESKASSIAWAKQIIDARAKALTFKDIAMPNKDVFENIEVYTREVCLNALIAHVVALWGKTVGLLSTAEKTRECNVSKVTKVGWITLAISEIYDSAMALNDVKGRYFTDAEVSAIFEMTKELKDYASSLWVEYLKEYNTLTFHGRNALSEESEWKRQIREEYKVLDPDVDEAGEFYGFCRHLARIAATLRDAPHLADTVRIAKDICKRAARQFIEQSHELNLGYTIYDEIRLEKTFSANDPASILLVKVSPKGNKYVSMYDPHLDKIVHSTPSQCTCNEEHCRHQHISAVVISVVSPETEQEVEAPAASASLAKEEPMETKERDGSSIVEMLAVAYEREELADSNVLKTAWSSLSQETMREQQMAQKQVLYWQKALSCLRPELDSDVFEAQQKLWEGWSRSINPELVEEVDTEAGEYWALTLKGKAFVGDFESLEEEYEDVKRAVVTASKEDRLEALKDASQVIEFIASAMKNKHNNALLTSLTEQYHWEDLLTALYEKDRHTEDFGKTLKKLEATSRAIAMIERELATTETYKGHCIWQARQELFARWHKGSPELVEQVDGEWRLTAAGEAFVGAKECLRNFDPKRHFGKPASRFNFSGMAERNEQEQEKLQEQAQAALVFPTEESLTALSYPVQVAAFNLVCKGKERPAARKHLVEAILKACGVGKTVKREVTPQTKQPVTASADDEMNELFPD